MIDTIGTGRIRGPIKLGAATILAALILGGCSTVPDIYYWGEYEQLIYQMYKEPEKAPPIVQIEKLNIALENAANEEMSVPPGFYAHLGFLYALIGEEDKSVSSFEQEKKLFPESAVMIDGMFERALKNKPGTKEGKE